MCSTPKKTIHNLGPTLSLELNSARRGQHQDDAKKDGFDDCAERFGQLAKSEAKSIQGLVRCLDQHIGDSELGE